MDDREVGAVMAGRYRLVRKLGEGGMGVVWSASHLVTDKQVALKMLKPESAGDPKVRARFLREARAACTVRHPNIVAVHDVLESEDGAPFMVMDLLEGESLGEHLARTGALSIEDAARLLVPVVSAVGAAHAAGIVHRDLKPDNIFLVHEAGGPPSVKVLDFGIAKVYARTIDDEAGKTGGLTGTGAMLGTPYYMSPEQIFGEKDIDHRADVWAVGIILFECLAGRRPTQAESVGQIIKIVSLDGLPRLDEVAPHLPRDITALVERMLTRDRSVRPQGLGEVFTTLRRFTDAAARTFGEPATRRAGVSDPAPSPAPIIDHANAHAATALAAKQTVLDTREASSTAGPFSSPEARTFGPARSSKAAPLAIGALVIAGAIALAAFRMSAASAPPLPSSASSATNAPSPPPVVSVATAIAASSTIPSASIVPSASAAPVKTPRIVKSQPPIALMVSAKPTVDAPAPKASQTGGIVEKSPY